MNVPQLVGYSSNKDQTILLVLELILRLSSHNNCQSTDWDTIHFILPYITHRAEIMAS